MPQISGTADTAISTGCYWASYLSEDWQVAAFDKLVPLFSDHGEDLKLLSRSQKLAFIRQGYMDPQGAVDEAVIAVFDAKILSQHPEMRQALATIPHAQKLALAEQEEPRRTQNVTLTLFDAQVMISAHPGTAQERNDLAASLRLLTPEQKLRIVEESRNDPAMIERKLRLAIFDAKFLQAMPHGSDAEKAASQANLALLTEDQKLTIIATAQNDPARAERMTKLAIFDAKFLQALPHGTEAERKAAQDKLALLTEDQKLKIVDDAQKDPAAAERQTRLTIFDAQFLQAMPHGTDAEKAAAQENLALLTDDQKLAIVAAAQADPAAAERMTKLAIFDAKFLQAAPHATEAEKAASLASLALLTEDQKLKIIDGAREDPAHPDRAANETRLALFDAAVLKDHPEMKDKLALIPDAEKLRLADEAEPQRTEDITIALFEASMQGMYAQHPDLKAKIGMIPRDKKLQLIGAVQQGLKQDPQLLEHIDQAMQDHPQAFDSAITSLIENPEKKNQLLGLIAADQMQHKFVDMVGGPDSAFGKVVNWIFDFLIDGPLGGFLLGIFGGLMGSMNGLGAAASAPGNNGRPSLQGTSANFEIAHTIVHGTVEDAGSGKIYHLDGELNDEEKAELDTDRDVRYTYDQAARQTTVSSANRNWSLAAAP